MGSWITGGGAVLKRWAALVQLAYLEANNGRTASLRWTGITRARRIAFRYCFIGFGPVFLVIIPDALGLHGGLLWWGLASITGAWAMSMVILMVVVNALSIWRAARIRRALDRGEASRLSPQRV